MNFIPPNIDLVKKTFLDYSDISLTGRGGFKAVYSAKLIKNMEALKIVFIPSENDLNLSDEHKKDFILEAKNRILREISLLAKCKCPFIVKLGKLKPKEVLIDDKSYIAYSEEFINGQTLGDLIIEKYKPSEQELISLLKCLLLSVENLWLGFRAIHRDIKPLNIIKTSDPKRLFVLLDLGIAYIISETPLTVSPELRMPPGTTKYLSPEMLNPSFRGTIDFRSDLYAIGITVYEFATSIHPLARDSDDLLLTLTRIIKEKPKPLKEQRPDLSDEFCTTIDRMLKKIVALRPSDITKLIKTVEQL